MESSRNRLNEHLGVNKMGKNIRRNPLHQPNFATDNNAPRQQPQPQVYNISKNDFRYIVQQLTGSPLHDPFPRHSHNLPKPQSMRLQRIRPPPLTPIINGPPHIAPPAQAPSPAPPPPHSTPYNNNMVRRSQFGLPSPAPLPPFIPGDSAWPNVAESPISAYMRYLQSSMIDPTPRGMHPQTHPQAQQGPGQFMAQPPSSVPNQPMPPFPSPKLNDPGLMSAAPNPYMPPLPSPSSQFLVPSPSGYLNLLSPRSPYALLSPGVQFPPMMPNFAFSPMGQPGILGSGLQPLPSPGVVFPLSPSWFFPLSSPRWRG